MSQTAPNPRPPSRLKKILQGLSDDQKQKPARRPGDASASQPAETGYHLRNRYLPAFWTVASIISMVVNVILIAILLIALRMLGTIQLTADDQFSGMLGGLYHNFVRMDQATILANIPVQATIPLDINVPVRTPVRTEQEPQGERILLARDATIPRAHVKITEGGVQIDAFAEVILPKDTELWIKIDPAFNLPVHLDIPINLTVPVNIPLNQTQLHEPFVGLQEVVRPYYCLVEPNATLNGVQICSPLASPVILPTPTFTVVP